jgi:hypothetical protein
MHATCAYGLTWRRPGARTHWSACLRRRRERGEWRLRRLPSPSSKRSDSRPRAPGSMCVRNRTSERHDTYYSLITAHATITGLALLTRLAQVDEKFCHFASSACALFPPNTRTVLNPKGDLGAAIAHRSYARVRRGSSYPSRRWVRRLRAVEHVLLLRTGMVHRCNVNVQSGALVIRQDSRRWVWSKLLSAEAAGLNTRKPSTVRRSRRRMTVRNQWCQVEAKHHWQSTA